MPVCTRPHSCPSCHKRFVDEERLENHLRAHGSEEFKPKQCNICFKRFLNNSALGSHLRTHNGQGSLWECSICKETYCNREGLKGHVASHSNNGSFSCPFCQKVFSGYLSIRKHIIKIHKSSGVRCSLCDRYCSNPQKYKEHMLRHSDEKQFSCEHCEKQFKRNDKLKEHIKRMHGCELAKSKENNEIQEEKKQSKKKSTEMIIERKLRDLNEQYLFKCQPCLLGFKRRGMLVNHIAKYHPNITPDEVPELNLPIMKTTRDFYCHLCEKVYKSNAKRKAHIMKFHPGAVKLGNASFDQLAGTVAKKPEHCPWCHKQYATNAKLLQHVRSQHSDKSYKELRKRGKSQVEKFQAESIELESKFYEEEVHENEMGLLRIDDSNVNESSSEGSSIDSCGSDMFFAETEGTEIYSSENSPVSEAEVGMQLESFLAEEDDDLTLAVCLMMSHANMSPVEASNDDMLVDSSEIDVSDEELSDADTSIGEVTTLGEASLTTEDVDLLMAEWLVDLQAGPPFAQSTVQRALDSQSDCEIGTNISSAQMAVCDGDSYDGSDYHLYDISMNLSSNATQLPPPQVVYSPYPPH